MIIRGGYNVYPREIDEVLYEHPAVREAAVVSVPDDLLGEAVGAAIALAPGAEADAAEIRDFVKERVAGQVSAENLVRRRIAEKARPARSSNAISPCPCGRDVVRQIFCSTRSLGSF